MAQYSWHEPYIQIDWLQVELGLLVVSPEMHECHFPSSGNPKKMMSHWYWKYARDLNTRHHHGSVMFMVPMQDCDSSYRSLRCYQYCILLAGYTPPTQRGNAIPTACNSKPFQDRVVCIRHRYDCFWVEFQSTFLRCISRVQNWTTKINHSSQESTQPTKHLMKSFQFWLK